MELTHNDIEQLSKLIVQDVAALLSAQQTAGRWLTMKEAQEYAKASRNTLKKWIKNGDIYGSKRTGDWIIDRESIDHWYEIDRY